MAQAQNRMLPKHARTGVTHHRSDLFAPGGLITVDRAFDTNGLLQPKTAAVEPHGGIIQQLLALRTKGWPGRVMIPAINGDHRRNGLPFPDQTLQLAL